MKTVYNFVLLALAGVLCFASCGKDDKDKEPAFVNHDVSCVLQNRLDYMAVVAFGDEDGDVIGTFVLDPGEVYTTPAIFRTNKEYGIAVVTEASYYRINDVSISSSGNHLIDSQVQKAGVEQSNGIFMYVYALVFEIGSYDSSVFNCIIR